MASLVKNVVEGKIFLDKFLTKEYFVKAGVKCADYFHFSKVKEEEVEEMADKIEAKFNKEYPVFGKPTTMSLSRGTAVVNSRKELVDYLRFTMQLPGLDFMIETFLSGQHFNLEGFIVDGEVVFDQLMYLPIEPRGGMFGKPMVAYLLPYESEIYKKGHEALQKFVRGLPHAQNTIISLEFVYMNGEAYVEEACKRVQGNPFPLFAYESFGVNYEEALAKLSIGRSDFYIPPPRPSKST